MQKLLIFSDAIAEAINKYYDKYNSEERILLLYLKKGEEGVYVDRIVYPPDEAYRVSSQHDVGLNAEYLLEQIINVIKEGTDGIMLVHNHIKFIPLFSSSDRRANKQFFRFFRKNNLGIIAGSAVYAQNKVSYVTNSDLLRNSYCVRLQNERG